MKRLLILYIVLSYITLSQNYSPFLKLINKNLKTGRKYYESGNLDYAKKYYKKSFFQLKNLIKKVDKNIEGLELGIDFESTFNTIKEIFIPLPKPVIKNVKPEENAIDVKLNEKIMIEFNVLMDTVSLNEGIIVAKDGIVEGNLQYKEIDKKTIVEFTPKGGFELNSTYNVEILESVTNIEGLELGEDFLWEFKTIIYNNTPPSKPDNIEIISKDPKIIINWNRSFDLDGDEICYDIIMYNEKGDSIQLKNGLSGTFYTADKSEFFSFVIGNEVKLYLEIIALEKEGENETKSEIKEFIFLKNLPPSKPLIESVEANENVLNIKWTESNDNEKDELKYVLKVIFKNEIIFEEELQSTYLNQNVEVLTDGEYEINLMAIDEFGNESESDSKRYSFVEKVNKVHLVGTLFKENLIHENNLMTKLIDEYGEVYFEYILDIVPGFKNDEEYKREHSFYFAINGKLDKGFEYFEKVNIIDKNLKQFIVKRFENKDESE